MQEIIVYDSNGNSLPPLVQWDKNVSVQFPDLEIDGTPRVHFFTNDMEESYVVIPETAANNRLTAKIPNVLLTQHHTITGYLNTTNNEEVKSIYGFRISIRRAPKPSDYIYDHTPDYISLEAVQKECQEYALTAAREAADAAENADRSALFASAAKDSELNAADSQKAAERESVNAAASAANAKASADSSQDAYLKSQSYAVGTDGTVRENDQLDNAKYYFEQVLHVAQGLQGALLPMGTLPFSELAELTDERKKPGYMYNISDSFTTDESFKDGANYQYPEGTNVYYTADGYWDCLAGTFLTADNFEEITDEYLDGLFIP